MNRTYKFIGMKTNSDSRALEDPDSRQSIIPLKVIPKWSNIEKERVVHGKIQHNKAKKVKSASHYGPWNNIRWWELPKSIQCPNWETDQKKHTWCAFHIVNHLALVAKIHPIQSSFWGNKGLPSWVGNFTSHLSIQGSNGGHPTRASVISMSEEFHGENIYCF